MKKIKIQILLFCFLVFSPFLSTNQKGPIEKNEELLRGVRGGRFTKGISTGVIMIKKMNDLKTNVKKGGRREFALKF